MPSRRRGSSTSLRRLALHAKSVSLTESGDNHLAESKHPLRDRRLDRAAQLGRHPATQTGVSALSLLELLHPGLGAGLTAAGSGVTSALGARMDQQARVTYERTRNRIVALEERGKFAEDQLRREVEQTGTIVKGLLNAAQDHADKIDWYADLLAPPCQPGARHPPGRN